ncbi:chaperone protein dnaJ 8, chloroplastic [Andrographis paniculata]|uniref:chaperone protein dnaJ 8, chloroplastic n=1 Tax=Andrographis paniculata TaxID=175694 RepID=UPI0021E8E12A|nr:chaperone protein dnaJ 8, chloroplastic [Andrographis paniculata]
MAASVMGSISWAQIRDSKLRNGNCKKVGFRVSCLSSSSIISDSYRTLKINPGASESEVKKAFRQLALKYHPDVCRGSNCRVQFHQINEAYDVVMSNLREEPQMEIYEQSDNVESDEAVRGMYGEDWELWEEWMGWEGAGIRDYSSHINPYI